VTMAELTEQQEQILTFERQWWKFAGAKEAEIRERFAMSSARYYQVLNVLIDEPAALAYDAMLVHRLRRLREARAVQRRSRLRGFDLGGDEDRGLG